MSDVRRINVALQGGGAHGAFTWGVLDRLLEDDGIEIAAISGTSAGALNGAALKAGLVAGLIEGGPARGRELARANLDWFWEQVGAVDDGRMQPWFMTLAPEFVSEALQLSLPYAAIDFASRLFSPYDYGPAYENPLAAIAARFRYREVHSDLGPDLHVCATNVRTGKIRVFTNADIDAKSLLASACLPTIFRAVEIEDPATGELEAYWDGGYTGNPALYPLFEPALPADIVVININPLRRERLPVTAQEIRNRINEISFNTSLLRELRAIEFAQRLLATGAVPEGALKRVIVHMISDDDLMNRLSVATKAIPVPGVLAALKAAGRDAADAFLGEHRERIGVESSVDLVEMFA